MEKLRPLSAYNNEVRRRSIMREEWKEIEGYKGRYQVSNLGRVKSLAKEWVGGKGCRRSKPDTILRNTLSNGYYNVKLNSKHTKKVHHLVWDAFGEKPRNKTKQNRGDVIDHIDEDKTNNCIDNLQLLTPRENIAKYHQSKRDLPTGVSISKDKYYIAQIYIDGNRYHLGYHLTPFEASRAYQEAARGI